jgi:hypothetical protein
MATTSTARTEAAIKADSTASEGVQFLLSSICLTSPDPPETRSPKSAKSNVVPEEAIAALKRLRQEPWERKEEAMRLLLKVLVNIEQEPENVKYRSLNEFNPTLSNKLFSVDGCCEFLEAMGFKHARDHKFALAGSDLSTVQEFRKELEQFVQDETFRQRRKERDGKIAAEKAKDAKPTVKGWRAARVNTTNQTASAEPPSEVATAAPTEDIGNPDKMVMTVWLQSVALRTPLNVSVEATVGTLREGAANLKHCKPHQVRLVLASSNKLLRWNYQLLANCNVVDNSEVLFSVMESDEVEEASSALKHLTNLKEGPGGAPFNSWTFTRKCFDVAVSKGLPKERAVALKRELHSGQITLKELRMLLKQEIGELAEAQEDEEEEEPSDPFEAIEQEFTDGVSRVTSLVDTVGKNREYSQLIARHNAYGLRVAQNRLQVDEKKQWYCS